MASSGDEQSDKECPLCMEPLELDDVNFYPCKCEYQICRFCWHRIRTDENGLCPACRQAYPEDPVNFKPLSAEELQRIKSEKKQKQQQHKQKVSESRKHLANLRVLQKNLVYVVGLSPRIADPEVLKKPEYFGKYGRIHKVVVGAANTAQSSNCTAYVTYVRAEDALKAIQNVNNVNVDGRTVKASLGTTKYCSSYLRNQPCHKPECMYLHDVAEEDASFTKEDMHAGRHSDYEKRLHDLMASQILQQRRADSSSSSPKDSGYFDQQSVFAGEVTLDENAESSTHRQSRQHNPPPRHRHRITNRETSKSSERGQSEDRTPEASGSNPSPELCLSGSSSQQNNDQLERPLPVPAPPDHQLHHRQQLIAEDNSPVHQRSAPPPMPGDWPGRLLAAMQAQVNNQSLFSQDETVFARQAQAKAQSGVQSIHHHPHQHHNVSLLHQEHSSSSASEQHSGSVMEGQHNHHTPQETNGLRESAGSAELRAVMLGQTQKEEGAGRTEEDRLRMNHSFMNGLPQTSGHTQRLPGKHGQESVVLSDEALEVKSQTDWLAAFGLKNPGGAPAQSVYQMRPEQPPAPSKPAQHDDDLGFDPFSVSSQGLADMLEEEQAEKEKAIRDQQEQILRQQQHQHQLHQHQQMCGQQLNPHSNSFNPQTTTVEWNYPFPPQGSQLSPSSGFVPLGGSNGQPFPKPGEGMLRPSVPGSSPIPQHFTTPPPGFPPGIDGGSVGGKLYNKGGMYPSGFNGVRQPPTGRHLPPMGMAAGPPPHAFLPGFLPGGAREPSPTHPLPPRGGPARSVSPHGDAFNLKEWQEGLKNLLPPGVPIKFAPGLGGGNGAPQGHPTANPSWMQGGRHPQPMGHPFTQPPPPLQVQTSCSPMGPPPMRHSPPGGDQHYCIPPPPFPGPRPGPGGMPPVYQTGGGWASLTPPPPGFSPRQQQSL